MPICSPSSLGKETGGTLACVPNPRVNSVGAGSSFALALVDSNLEGFRWGYLEIGSDKGGLF
jgi:hypothetical protein